MLQRNWLQTDSKCTDRALNLVLVNKSLRPLLCELQQHPMTPEFTFTQPLSLCSPPSVLLAPLLLLGCPHTEEWAFDYCVFCGSSAWYTICFALSFETRSHCVLGSLCKPGWPTSNQKTCMPLLLSSTGIKQVCTTRPGWPLTASNPPVPGSWVLGLQTRVTTPDSKNCLPHSGENPHITGQALPSCTKPIHACWVSNQRALQGDPKDKSAAIFFNLMNVCPFFTIYLERSPF